MTDYFALCHRLRQFDTPTICNVIELFNVRPHTAGYMNSTIQACFPETPSMVGFAATATCRTAIAPRGAGAYHHLADQIARFDELSGPPVVVFQDLDNPVTAATFGEIMCSAYQAFGAVGLITNGGGRDLDQVQALGFPVFTGGTICSHGYIHILDVHIPVQVGGMVIYADDLLHGDRNGGTVIPRYIAVDIADVAAEFVAAEQIILDVLQGGDATITALRTAAREADEQIHALRRRVSRSASV